jgi:hypothetical protein
MAFLSEAYLEQALLEQLRTLGYHIERAEDIGPDGPRPERASMLFARYVLLVGTQSWPCPKISRPCWVLLLPDLVIGSLSIYCTLMLLIGLIWRP